MGGAEGEIFIPSHNFPSNQLPAENSMNLCYEIIYELNMTLFTNCTKILFEKFKIGSF